MIIGSDGSETEREVRQILDLVLEREMNINILWGYTAVVLQGYTFFKLLTWLIQYQ